MHVAIDQVVSKLRRSFEDGKTQSILWRKEQLRSLYNLVIDNRDRFAEAIHKDIAQPKVQVEVLEVLCVANEIVHFLHNLDDWLKDEPVSTLPPFENWSPVIRRRPRGLCLILGTWNYPLTLTLLPLIGIIAAGNTGILRPSEFAPNTADLLAELFPKYLDSSCFQCVPGGKEAAESLLKHQYGHILFTGGQKVGKEVMKSAANSLSSLTLEMGGRNAVIVSDKANVHLAAKRTLWAKATNAGQTCFAPNVAVVHQAVFEQFVECVKQVHYDFYKGKPDVNTVGRIVNSAQFARVKNLLSSTKGKIALGGELDEASLYIEPTLIVDLPLDDALLQNEVFGPILPVVRATDIAHAIGLAKSLAPESLGLYVFSEDLQEANTIINTVANGSSSINDVMAQIAPPGLPFGGFADSGFGAYRGKASIDTFSHLQSVVTVPTSSEFEAMLEWRYPYADPDATVDFIRANMVAPLPPS